jgi:hypothetical protein
VAPGAIDVQGEERLRQPEITHRRCGRNTLPDSVLLTTGQSLEEGERMTGGAVVSVIADCRRARQILRRK